MRTVLVLAALLGTATLHAQQTARVVTTVTKGAPAWKSWKNEACTINHPGAWAVDASGTTGTVVTFLSPRDSTGRAPARVELAVADLNGRFADLLQDHAPGPQLKDMRVVSDELHDDQHLRGLEGELDGRAVRVEQSAWLHAGQVYILSYIADTAAYEEELVKAQAMINSFRFLP